MLLEFCLAFFGSTLALLGVGSELLYLVFPKLRPWLDALGEKVQLKKSDSPIAGLRQIMLFAASILLLIFVVVQRQPVYISLQAYIQITSTLWFLEFGKTREALKSFEKAKSFSCLILAGLVWIILEVFGLCPGFHRVATMGLLVVAFGYVVVNPLLRNPLCIFGAWLLALYGVLGMRYDTQGFGTYLNAFCVNLMFGLICGAIFVVTLAQPKVSR